MSRVRVERNGDYWRAVAVLGDGRKVRHGLGRVGGKSKRAAQQLADEWADRSLFNRHPRAETADEEPTIIGWFDRVAEQRGASSRRTRDTYSHSRNHLARYLGGTDPKLREWHEQDAEAFRNHLLGRGLAEQTVRDVCRRIKIAFGDAIKLRVISGPNPWDAVPTTTVKTDQEWQYVTADNVLAIVPRLSTETADAIMLARFGGLRLQEIHRAEWRDIQTDAKMVTIRHQGRRTTKRRMRLVPMSPELLNHFKGRSGRGAVLTGTPASRTRAMYAEIRSALSSVGLPSIASPFQDCRRSRITDWCAVIPIADVAKIAGNSVEVIENHYHQVLPSVFDTISSTLAPKALQ